jgi:secreted protein with Ig-like and vWFA domain
MMIQSSKGYIVLILILLLALLPIFLIYVKENSDSFTLVPQMMDEGELMVCDIMLL